jgi:heme O synthase-like polyprenyltransferase
MGFNSIWYFFGALLLGIAFCGTAAKFLWRRDRPSARLLFFSSIIYLPLVLGLLVFFKR